MRARDLGVPFDGLSGEHNAITDVPVPVVADTWDGDLSDWMTFPLRESHVFGALDSASSGRVAEGNVGGGTGMICHEFKGGIGTASRVVVLGRTEHAVGVLVQANYGERSTLRIAGAPVGREIADLLPELPEQDGDADFGGSTEDGSILVIVATDAPVSYLTLKAMARRATLGLARNGATANPTSGDAVVAFGTERITPDPSTPHILRSATVNPYAAKPLFQATIEATEEAVINALVAAKTTTGRNGGVVHALPHDRLREVLRKYNRLGG